MFKFNFKILLTATAGLFALVTSTSGLHAATETFCPGTADTTNREFSITAVPTATCLMYGTDNIGNGANDPFLIANSSYQEIDDSGDGTVGGFGITTTLGGLTATTGTLLSGLSGTVMIDWSKFSDTYSSIAVGLKSGGPMNDNRWAVFGLDPAVTSFDWTISGKRQALSHIVLYGTVSQVPLPASGLLLIGGLGGVAALRRRRKKAA